MISSSSRLLATLQSSKLFPPHLIFAKENKPSKFTMAANGMVHWWCQLKSHLTSLQLRSRFLCTTAWPQAPLLVFLKSSACTLLVGSLIGHSLRRTSAKWHDITCVRRGQDTLPTGGREIGIQFNSGLLQEYRQAGRVRRSFYLSITIFWWPIFNNLFLQRPTALYRGMHWTWASQGIDLSKSWFRHYSSNPCRSAKARYKI